VALNLWKDAGRRRRLESDAAIEETPATGAAGGEQEALARLEQHEVRQAVERLPEPRRCIRKPACPSLPTPTAASIRSTG
jgi:DNA-directed RNA polymerase specialized sigma24 family protein